MQGRTSFFRYFMSRFCLGCLSVIGRSSVGHRSVRAKVTFGCVLLLSEQPIGGIYYTDLFAVMFDYACLSVHNNQC